MFELREANNTTWTRIDIALEHEVLSLGGGFLLSEDRENDFCRVVVLRNDAVVEEVQDVPGMTRVHRQGSSFVLTGRNMAVLKNGRLLRICPMFAPTESPVDGSSTPAFDSDSEHFDSEPSFEVEKVACDVWNGRSWEPKFLAMGVDLFPR